MPGSNIVEIPQHAGQQWVWLYHRICWMRCFCNFKAPTARALQVAWHSPSERKRDQEKTLNPSKSQKPKGKGSKRLCDEITRTSFIQASKQCMYWTVCMHLCACMLNLLKCYTELWQAKSINVSLHQSQKGPASESFTPGSMVYALDYTMTLGFKTQVHQRSSSWNSSPDFLVLDCLGYVADCCRVFLFSLIWDPFCSCMFLNNLGLDFAI